ncbi:MAG TPA: Asp-tRNA(Asn)/Glu-tRNA(Gln) amidotransferase subunit GatC [Vicinamibacteria bacterium]
MAQVTVDVVEHVARLARLSLTPEEKERFARELQEILSYAETIQALDTESVEPMSHAAATGALRDDDPRPGLDRERVLAEAPDAEAGLFRVPRVIA